MIPLHVVNGELTREIIDIFVADSEDFSGVGTTQIWSETLSCAHGLPLHVNWFFIFSAVSMTK